VRTQSFDFDTFDERPRGGRKQRFDDEARSVVRRGRLTDLERERLAAAQDEAADWLEIPGGGDRWSTWGEGELGPEPYPDWLITEEGAVDTRLGVVKTGKEAEVHLVERSVPGTGRACLLAEKRYRSADHRLFHRDAGYLEGRRTKESRMERAISNRTNYGRKLIAEQWAAAEFAALHSLWTAGAPVPYPVQRMGTDLLLEFIGDADGGAAPRLAQERPTEHELSLLWGQLGDGLAAVARSGFTHGDLSAYNILVHDGRLVLIDLPQVVDLAVNPRGREVLMRDVRNIAGWFAARGLREAGLLTADLVERLYAEAGLPISSGI
jgi:RIO kinase 1